MSAREVNEIASSPRGVTVDPAEQKSQQSKSEERNRVAERATNAAPAPTGSVAEVMQGTKGVSQSIATITKGGKVEFEKLGQKG